MARAELTVLSKDELEMIHEASLRVLEEVGVKVLSSSVRTMLAEHGAEVEGEVVKIPPSMVEEALKTVPKEVTLAARDPKWDLKIPVERDYPYTTIVGVSGKVYDLETGEKREATLEDLRSFAVLADYFDDVDFMWPVVMAADVPTNLRAVQSYVTALKNNRKHAQWDVFNAKEARWIIKIASAVIGGEDKLKDRPIVSVAGCPICPLVFEAGITEAFIEFAKAGLPVMPFSMPLMGMTCPATLAGFLTIGNCENLATLVMIQCANPGTPMIYCIEGAPMNPYTGKIWYEAVETPLLNAAGIQMARFYGLPCYSLGAALEGRPRDWDALLIRAAKMALGQMAHGDITAGFGSLEEAEYAALDQFILDVEAWRIARAYLRSFDVSEEALGLEAIKKAKPGGSFLTLKHTLKYFETEVFTEYKPKILAYPFRGSIIDEARRKAREILETHEPSSLEEDVEREVDRLLEEARRDLLKGS